MCATTILCFEGLKTKNFNHLAHVWEKTFDKTLFVLFYFRYCTNVYIFLTFAIFAWKGLFEMKHVASYSERNDL